ncbi:MAG: hypothetical protein KDB53_21420, partial [Planctomycetes bacterium]|nr:hypothetical protein [Planctomycetota bacterium]
IVFTVVGMAALCFFAAPELSGATALGRGLSAFLSLFWWARLFFQLFYYDRDVRRRYRVVDALFVVAFVYLAVVFALGASAGLIEP